MASTTILARSILALGLAFLYTPTAPADDALGPAQPGIVGALDGNHIYLQAETVDTLAPPLRTLAELARTARGSGPIRYHVVQLAGPMRPEWRARMVEAGIEIGDYLPVNAFIVRLQKFDASKAAGLDFVLWHSEFLSRWKIAPGLGRRPFSTTERIDLAGAGNAGVLISLFRGEGPAELLQALAAFPRAARVHWTADIGGCTAVCATISSADAAALASLATVQFVEDAPEITLRNDTDRWIVQSNIAGSFPLYDQGLHGEGQILGLIDTRMDRNHCSFVDSDPIGPLHRKIQAYNGSAGAEFHGTHVAGTAVGDAGNDTATRGIAYLGRVVYNTIPAFTESAILARLNLHHSQGGTVHTNSWGDDGTTAYNGLCRGFDSFQYSNEDGFVCLAVTNTSTLKNPENAKNLLAVGGSQDTPGQQNHCTGGNGPTSDGRRKPEIYAPGCATVSASSGTSCGTTTATGTSMASPAIAGTAMLVRQYFMEGFYPTGTRQTPDAFTPSGALIKATLLNSAVDMTGINGYPSTREGWGRVLAGDALHFDSDARVLFARDVRNAQGLSTGNTVEIPVEVLTSGQPLKFTLVWTEPPAASGAAFAAINDLNLEVVAPDATLFRGNVFTNGQSSSGGSADDRNNVEQVHVTTPGVGTWLVRIRATAVNQGLQGYSLAVTGDITNPDLGISMSPVAAFPQVIEPGQEVALAIRIMPGDDTIVAGSPSLHHRFDTAGAFQSVPLSTSGDGIYTAILPGPECAQIPQFYFSAAGVVSGTTTLPSGGALDPFSAIVGAFQAVISEDFESGEAGWAGGVPADNATAGQWTLFDPNGTVAAPEDDHTSAPGVQCWMTGQDFPFPGPLNDVDGGSTTLLSPLLDLSAHSVVRVSYWRWYSNNTGPAPGEDSLSIQICNNDGGAWLPVETVGPTGSESVGGWFFHEFLASDLLPMTDRVRLRFVAADLASDSTVEAAIDDFQVEAVICTPPCLCDWDQSGTLDSQDFFDFVTDFFAGAADFNEDGATDSQDFFDFLACFFDGCP